MILVPFVFLAPCTLTSCSSDSDQEDTSQQDYQALLTAHDWEISEAAECVGGFWLDVKEVDAYCSFAADSVYCSEGETVNHFDEDGKVTESKYEITPCGKYPYAVKGDEIKIDNQTFKITSTATDTFVLENEDWRLVLEKKQSK